MIVSTFAGRADCLLRRFAVQRSQRFLRPNNITQRIRAPRRPNSTSSKPEKTSPSSNSSAGFSTSAKQSNTGPGSATPKTIPGPSWLWLEPLTVPFRYYSRAQNSRPYITQLVSSAVIYFFGDLSAQSLNSQTPSSDDEDVSWYDPYRTLRSLTIGLLFSIPSYKWFMYLGSHVNPFSSFKANLAAKVVVNQAVFTPIFNTYFFGMQAILQGCSPREVWDRVRMTVPTSCWNSAKLWPLVTAVSFTWVKPEFRSVFAGVVAIGWQTYLALLNQRAAEVEERVREVEEQALGKPESRGERRQVMVRSERECGKMPA